MHRRKLGELEVPALGLGCMGMSNVYGPADEAESIAAIHRAIDTGMNFLDSSDAYGDGHNEELLGRALKGRRDRVVLATKFGNTRTPDGKPDVDGRPEYVRKACEASLKRLQADVIDLYYIHRIDTRVPIEDTVGTMAGLKKQGKLRYLGLSEAAPATIRRAHATHPIAAVQSEWSLWTRDMEAEVIPTCRALGIGFVPYSPFGRGFLAATVGKVDDLPAKDRQREHPRFAPENIQRNLALLAPLREIAAARGATPAQVALAWVLSRGEDVVPIPGTKRAAYVDENTKATALALSADDLAKLSKAFPPGVTAGLRYPEAQMKRLGL
jgi:aryl-alcohol dehydrogenase-like predicted oxidoreductase